MLWKDCMAGARPRDAYAYMYEWALSPRDDAVAVLPRKSATSDEVVRTGCWRGSVQGSRRRARFYFCGTYPAACTLVAARLYHTAQRRARVVLLLLKPAYRTPGHTATETPSIEASAQHLGWPLH